MTDAIPALTTAQRRALMALPADGATLYHVGRLGMAMTMLHAKELCGRVWNSKCDSYAYRLTPAGQALRARLEARR